MDDAVTYVAKAKRKRSLHPFLKCNERLLMKRWTNSYLTITFLLFLMYRPAFGDTVLVPMSV